jgi:hypothetical protein
MTTIERRASRIAAVAAKTAAILFATALVAAPALAQRHAVPRSGGGGGGGGGGFSGRSPGASGPSVSPGGSGGAHRIPGSGGGAPHRPTGDGRFGHGHGGHHHHGHYYPYYYPYYSFGFGFGYPYYYYPYYYGYGYSPYYYGYRPYGYYAPAPYYYGGYSAYGEGSYAPAYADRASLGAVAVKVKPQTAEVWLDGRYVGVAESFDGFPTYLWVAPGEHHVAVVHDGFANLERDIQVSAGHVVELEQKLQSGEASRPAPPADRGYSLDRERAPYPEDGGYRPPEGGYPPRDREPAPRDAQPGERAPSPDLGRLMLDVRPDDASVYLDGRFVGTGRDVSTATEPLLVVPGEHRLQVVHPQYSNAEQTVTMQAGEEKLVEITLQRGAGV